MMTEHLYRRGYLTTKAWWRFLCICQKDDGNTNGCWL